MTAPKANPHLFAAELTRQRKKRGMTQADLSKFTGLNSQYISLLENGRREAGLSTIVAICRALSIRPGDLLDIYFDDRRVSDQSIKVEL